MNEIIDVNLKILVKRIPVVRSQRWSGLGSLSWFRLIPLFFNVDVEDFPIAIFGFCI